MIRVDVIWLAPEPMDIRAGTEIALVRLLPYSARRSHTVLTVMALIAD